MKRNQQEAGILAAPSPVSASSDGSPFAPFPSSSKRQSIGPLSSSNSSSVLKQEISPPSGPINPFDRVITLLLQSDNSVIKRKALVQFLSLLHSIPAAPHLSSSFDPNALLASLLTSSLKEPQLDIQILQVRIISALFTRLPKESMSTPFQHTSDTLMRLLDPLSYSSCKLRTQVLDSLIDVMEFYFSSANTQSASDAEHLMSFCRSISLHLSDLDHRIRSRTLSFLSTSTCLLSKPSAAFTINAEEVQMAIAEFAADREPRVRLASLQSLLSMSKNSIPLHPSLYKSICVPLLRDDTQEIRLHSLSLLFELQSDRADSLFSSLCSMIRDASPAVRAHALSLIGSLPPNSISMSKLLETYEKESLEPISESKSAAFVSLTSTHASKELSEYSIGALSLGLEDEFQEVRLAAVNCIRSLSLSSSSSTSALSPFAKKSMEFLVDMFNDEIEQVRVASLSSLSDILFSSASAAEGSNALREDQIQIILALLEDLSVLTRQAVLRLLQVAPAYDSPLCLHACIQALLSTMERYPEDIDSILVCLSKLGSKHATFAPFLVQDLLRLDNPYIELPEPDVEKDIFYIAIMMFILNACVYSPIIIHMMPENHFVKHWRYLGDKYSALVPPVSTLYSTQQIYSSSAAIIIEEPSVSSVSQIVSIIETSFSSSALESLIHLETAREQLATLSHEEREEDESDDMTHFLALYISSLDLYFRLFNSFSSSSSSSSSITLSTISSQVLTLSTLINKIRFSFHLPAAVSPHLMDLQLFSSLIQYIVSSSPSSHAILYQRSRQTQKTSQLAQRVIQSFETNEKSQKKILQSLLSIVQSASSLTSLPQIMSSSSEIKRLSAVFTSPLQYGPDSPLLHNSIAPLSLKVQIQFRSHGEGVSVLFAKINALIKAGCISLRAEHANGRIDLFPLRTSDLSMAEEGDRTIKASLVAPITLPSCSAVTQLVLSIVRSYEDLDKIETVDKESTLELSESPLVLFVHSSEK